ncbi:MAG: iron complex outermembrane receptor protein [Gammaproteobacteria bacterium]|jgi:iron complex outermembrane receptor protein
MTNRTSGSWRLLLLVGALMTTLSAVAAEPDSTAVQLQPSAAEGPRQMERVTVTATRSAAPVLELAGNVDTLSTEQIDLVRADHPSEIFNRLLGVNIQRNNGFESLPSIRSPVLTGPGAAGAFLFLEDGVAMRAAGFANNNGLAEANFEQAGGIEVIRGPAGAFYGSNAVHGVLNVLSRAPSEDLQREVDFSAGPHDLYQIKATLSDTIGEHSYRVNAYGATDDGYRDNSGYGVQKLHARHDYQGSVDTIKTVLSVFNLNQETAGFISSGSNGGGCYTSNRADPVIYKDMAAMRRNCDRDAYRDWSSVRLSSRWDHEVSSNQSFNVTAYFRDNDMEFRQHFLPSRAIEENEHTSYGIMNGYTFELDAGHTVIVGVDAEYTDGSLKETQQAPDLFGFGNARPQGLHFDYDVDATVVAPYIHTEWQIIERLRATVGLRYEYTHYDYDNLIADGTTKADGTACINPAAPIGANEVECLFQRPADRKDDFHNYSSKIGATYRIFDDASMFVNWSRGIRAPQVTDLYRIQRRQMTDTIKSERIDSREIGFRGQTYGISYEAVYFNMDKENFFFRDTNGLNVTNGKTEHEGVEIGLVIPILDRFDAALNYTRAQHDYKSFRNASGIVKGNAVDTAPENIANTRFGWNFLSGGRAEIEWEHMGSYYLDPSNEHEYDGHDVFHLRVSKPVHKHVTLHARIDNLTDKAYATRADFAFGSYRFFGGEERTIHGGVTISF